MSEVIRSKRGQAVLISLQNGPDCVGGKTLAQSRDWGGVLSGEGHCAGAMARGVGVSATCLCRLSGALAQLGEHLLCKQRVIGSIPIGSTREVFERAARCGRCTLLGLAPPAQASKGSVGAFCRAGGADGMWVGSSGG